jgi:hypothetical protein
MNAVWSGANIALSCSIVPANFVVLASIRPWKSLMFSRLTVADSLASALMPTITGSWSLERNMSGTLKSVTFAL